MIVEVGNCYICKNGQVVIVGEIQRSSHTLRGRDDPWGPLNLEWTSTGVCLNRSTDWDIVCAFEECSEDGGSEIARESLRELASGGEIVSYELPLVRGC